mgnify:FL=1
MPFIFASCSSDEDEDNPIKDQIIGTWKMTHLDSGSGYIEVPSSMTQTYATFNQDGTYSGRGYFGNGTGTYSVSGKTIKCYVEGELYLTYTVINVTSSNAELKMSDGETDINVKCSKQ